MKSTSNATELLSIAELQQHSLDSCAATRFSSNVADGAAADEGRKNWQVDHFLFGTQATDMGKTLPAFSYLGKNIIFLVVQLN